MTPAQKLVSHALASNRRLVETYKHLGEAPKNTPSPDDNIHQEIIPLGAKVFFFGDFYSDDDTDDTDDNAEADWSWCLEHLPPESLAIRFCSVFDDGKFSKGQARLYQYGSSAKEREVVQAAFAALATGAREVTLRFLAKGHSPRDRAYGFIPIEDHVFRPGG